MCSNDESSVTVAFLWGSSHSFNFIRILPENFFFEEWPWFRFNYLGLVLGMVLKLQKRSKLKKGQT